MTPDQLNAIYVSETGIESRIHLGGGEKTHWWYEFTKAGFTETDLRTVLQRLMREIRAKRRKPACLRMSTLIGNLCNMEFELELCKNERLMKPPVKPAKQKFLESLHRQQRVPVTVAPSIAGNVNELLKQFRSSAD